MKIKKIIFDDSNPVIQIIFITFVKTIQKHVFLGSTSSLPRYEQ